MKVKHLLVGLCTALCGSVFVAPVHATSYSYDVDVQFSFNSKLGVTITDADIKILDLAPGTSADSNIVGITISTNNVAGYTAEATVGNAQNATTNMTHTNGTNTFTSIATDASQASLSTDNTWGYAISTDNGTSWSNFSGLPIYIEDGKQLAKTDSPASDAIQFKINAKASTSQPAGDYTNVINFKVVANTPPRDWKDVLPPDYCTAHPTECDTETNLPKIQAINEDICEAVEEYDTQFQVTDSRDHKNYWISKLRDNHCWMTQNLDLNLETTPNKVIALTSENTDLNTFGSNGYDTNNGYSKDTNDVITWTPERATIPTSNISSAGSISGWTNDHNNPYSIDTGDWYWIGNWNNNGADTWYQSVENNYLNVNTSDAGDKFSTSQYAGNAEHGHVGNYYNWTAAIASNDSSSYVSDTKSDISNNPQNSICPAGWRLPTVSNAGNVDGSTNEFKRLVTLYGNITNNDKALTANPMWFIRSGRINASNLDYSGYYGYYWSSTVNSSYYPYALGFDSALVNPIDSSLRYHGWSVRCVVRTKTPYVITFNANSGTGTMTSQQIKRGSSANISQNTFTRSGYFFNGWNTKADGTGVGYGDKELYTVASGSTENGITLYAQWLQDSGGGSGGGGSYGGRTLQRAFEVAYNKNPGAFDMGGGQTKHGLYYPVGDGTYREATSAADYQRPANELRFAMQDIAMTFEEDGVTYKVCDYATVIGSEAYVLDLRDYKSYWIAKLADGSCWMTQNLDYDLEHDRLLTPDTSDVLANWNPPYNTIHGTSAQKLIYSDGWGDSSPYLPYTYDPGTSLYYTDASGTNVEFSSKSDCVNAIGVEWEEECMHYHVGNSYSAAAAAAKSSTQGIHASGNYNFEESICPKGWVPPKGVTGPTYTQENTSGFDRLLSAYNIVPASFSGDIQHSDIGKNYISGNEYLSFAKPLYFVKGGKVSDRSWWVGVGQFMEYWEGTFNGDTVYYVEFGLPPSSNQVALAVRGRYYSGYSIRCVAR